MRTRHNPNNRIRQAVGSGQTLETLKLPPWVRVSQHMWSQQLVGRITGNSADTFGSGIPSLPVKWWCTISQVLPRAERPADESCTDGSMHG